MAEALLASELVIWLIIGILAIVAIGVTVGVVVCLKLIKKNEKEKRESDEEVQTPFVAPEAEEPEQLPEAPVLEEISLFAEQEEKPEAEEPMEEKAPEISQPEEEAVTPAEEEDDDGEEEEPVGKVMFASANRLVEVRYDKSYTARLIQTSEKNKSYYSELKNELLRYRRVKSRISWRQESFRKGRDLKAKMELRGKTLCLYLALDPAKFADSKYLVEDASDAKRNEEVPCKYRIKNDRRLRYAKELIAMVFEGTDAAYREQEPTDYAADFPYEETQPLIDRELIKLIRVREDGSESSEAEALALPEAHAVSATQAGEELSDEVARLLVRESGNVSVYGKQTVVNVDTLGEYFDEGDTVTLEDMRERIPFLNRSATYVKVLARGRLSKALVVEADDFSLDAIKMIVLAGGTVYRKRDE